MESNVIWVDFTARREGKPSETIDWLALAVGCEQQAKIASSEAVRNALLRVAAAYRQKAGRSAVLVND